jgi:excinuclease ABC subunit C
MRVFQFRNCELDIAADDPRRATWRPCLNYHIKRCSAPCTRRIDTERYGADIKALRAFLSGRGKKQVVSELRERMGTAAAEFRYEDAARYRDQLKAIDRLKERGRLRDYDGPAAPAVHGDEGLGKLQRALGLETTPRVVEGFDIAHLMGTNVVAAMVQFVDGLPNKDGYRRFRVKGDGVTPVGNDDFRAMEEVVGRRYRRLQDEGKPLPDIVLIDGGHGQVGAAMAACAAAGVTPPCLIGLAKKEETIICSDGSEVSLSRRNSGLKLLQYVRDEAHRFSRRYLHLLQKKDLSK